MRKKPNLERRTEKCAHLQVTAPQELRGRWLLDFPFEKLHVELGCGKGRFTIETAQAAPQVLIAAFEKSANVIISAIERADEAQLENVRFVTAMADNLTEFFAPGEVSRIYINFCDPWTANSHAKRRLTHSRFLQMYKKVLCESGEVHFKTDNLPLFEFSLREFSKCGFTQTAVTRDLHENGPVGVMTDYELKFHAQGMPIYHAIHRT